MEQIQIWAWPLVPLTVNCWWRRAFLFSNRERKVDFSYCRGATCNFPVAYLNLAHISLFLPLLLNSTSFGTNEIVIFIGLTNICCNFKETETKAFCFTLLIVQTTQPCYIQDSLLIFLWFVCYKPMQETITTAGTINASYITHKHTITTFMLLTFVTSYYSIDSSNSHKTCLVTLANVQSIHFSTIVNPKYIHQCISGCCQGPGQWGPPLSP